MTSDNERVAILEGEDAKAFYEYANSESTPEEKEELKKDLEYYRLVISKVN